MADVMEDRVRSIELCAGLGFTLGALVLSLSLVFYPTLPPASQTNLILDIVGKQDVGSWMNLHAFMLLGFLVVAAALTAFGFLLHLKGASGPASVVTMAALIGGGIWASFLSLEFFTTPFIKSYYPLEPGLATMLFNIVWYWKMGALAVGSVLLFVAVVAAGLSGTSRGILPVWLGWGGALFAVVGIAVYLFDFLGAEATGAAINPMRGTGVRFGIGLPLQVWLIAVGATLLRSYADHRAVPLPPQVRSPVPPRRPAAPKEPVGSQPEPPPLPPPIP
jgi:hypothetical protein